MVKRVPTGPPVPVVSEAEAKRRGQTGGARIVVPDDAMTEEFVHRLGIKDGDRICGNCKHFEHRRGQAELADQQLFEALFQEMEWDPMWVGRLDIFGLCGEIDGQMCTIVSPARVCRHLVTSDWTYENKDESTLCPAYREGASWRRKMVSTRKGQNYEE
jgi:hypothetical protein